MMCKMTVHACVDESYCSLTIETIDHVATRIQKKKDSTYCTYNIHVPVVPHIDRGPLGHSTTMLSL